MAIGLSIGEQWDGMLNMLSGCNQSMLSRSNGLMSLVWPLLPLLPPQPPPLLTELLREADATTEKKCDLCGKTGKTFVKCCGEILLMTQTELRHRQVGQKRSSIDRMIEVIEDRVDEILNSIEQTTIRINDLSRQKNNLYEKPAMTDVEILTKFKSLVKQKETHVWRVKTLEIEKQKVEESLITAILWAKSLKLKVQNITVSADLPHSIQKQYITLDQQRDSTQEDNNEENFVLTAENDITIDQQDTIKGIENDDNSTQEGIYNEENFTPTKENESIKDHKDIEENDDNYSGRVSVLEGQVTDVTIDSQSPLQKGISEVNVILGNVSQEFGINNNVIIINHLRPLDEELSKKSTETEA